MEPFEPSRPTHPRSCEFPIFKIHASCSMDVGWMADRLWKRPAYGTPPFSCREPVRLVDANPRPFWPGKLWLRLLLEKSLNVLQGKAVIRLSATDDVVSRIVNESICPVARLRWVFQIRPLDPEALVPGQSLHLCFTHLFLLFCLKSCDPAISCLLKRHATASRVYTLIRWTHRMFVAAPPAHAYNCATLSGSTSAGWLLLA